MKKLEEIKAKYSGYECESQQEFDRVMNTLNQLQSEMNHPVLDEERELNKKREALEIQMQSIRIQMSTLRLQRIDVEQKLKDINRVFHAIKHELIVINPREKYGQNTECRED
jgi:uncharacterized protein YoxC